MRRLLAALLVLAVPGCGDGDKKAGPKVTPTATAQTKGSTEEALEAVRDSNLPEDAKRELEEAAELLDESE